MNKFKLEVIKNDKELYDCYLNTIELVKKIHIVTSEMDNLQRELNTIDNYGSQYEYKTRIPYLNEEINNLTIRFENLNIELFKELKHNKDKVSKIEKLLQRTKLLKSENIKLFLLNEIF